MTRQSILPFNVILMTQIGLNFHDVYHFKTDFILKKCQWISSFPRMAMALMKYLSAWAPKQNRNMATSQEIFTKHAGIWDTRRVTLSAVREPRLLGSLSTAIAAKTRSFTTRHVFVPLKVQSQMMACDVLRLVDLLAGCAREARAWEKGVCVLKIQKPLKS